MVWACCWRSVDTRTYNATRIGRPFLLCYRRRRRPAQHQLVRLVPSVLPIGLLADLPPDLEGAPHGRPPAAGSAHSEGLHPPTSPQPQQPPPPGQPKLAMAAPAELVTCDQTIEHTIRFCKQTLGWVTPRVRHPEQPSGGPGWCWPPTPSCAWPASSPATSGWRGSGPARPASCRPTGSAGGFRACCAWRGRRPPRRNPPGAPQAGPRTADPASPCATLQSRSPPRNPGRSGPPPRRPERPNPPPPRPAADHRVKTQAKALISLLGGPFRAENGAGCPLTSLLFGR